MYKGREEGEKRKERRFKGKKRRREEDRREERDRERREEGMMFLQRRNIEREILPSMVEDAVL